MISHVSYLTTRSTRKMAYHGSERQPLIINISATEALGSPPAYSEGAAWGTPPAPEPPIDPDELPPSCTPSAQGEIPMVNCKVCQAYINIEGKTGQHVVKCNACKEATPIKAPPPGKRYVRCPCNCLLICRSAATRISCPRPNCKRITILNDILPVVTVCSPGTSRIKCGHCQQLYLFNVLGRSQLARCPHCRNVSSVGPGYAKRRAAFFFILGLMFLGAGVGVTVETYEMTAELGPIYILWIGCFLMGVLLIIRAIYFALLKVSHEVGPA